MPPNFETKGQTKGCFKWRGLELKNLFEVISDQRAAEGEKEECCTRPHLQYAAYPFVHKSTYIENNYLSSKRQE